MNPILSLESAWNQAEAKHDTGAMGLLIADVFEYTDSDGSFPPCSDRL